MKTLFQCVRNTTWVVLIIFAFLFGVKSFAQTSQPAFLCVSDARQPPPLEQGGGWEAVSFPLWLYKAPYSYWLNITTPSAQEERPVWLHFYWPDVWQWQMVTQTVSYALYADGYRVRLPAPTERSALRLIFPVPSPDAEHGLPSALQVRIDCLPYRVLLPAYAFATYEALTERHGDYACLFTGYLGFMLVLSVIALVLWVLLRDRIFLYYVLMIFAGMLAVYSQAPVLARILHIPVTRNYHDLFNMAMATYYMASLLFAGRYLDPARQYPMLHRTFSALILLCGLYLVAHNGLTVYAQEKILYMLDICGMIPLVPALYLWLRRHSRKGFYYVLINLLYVPIYLHFILVSVLSMQPLVSMYVALIAGAVTEGAGYALALALYLRDELRHKQCMEEEHQSLQSRQMELELLARNAELRMLRFQMNPHFLFNALNSLIAEIGECPAQAAQMARKLSAYLRYALTSRDWVSVAQEVESVQEYLELERFRYEDKLSVQIRVDSDTEAIRVPMFAIQPLVENALKYGMQTSAMPLQVRVTIECTGDDMLCIEVANTGRWVDPSVETTGIGLKNIEERIEKAYHGFGRFDVLQEEGWVTVRLCLPVTS